MKTTVKMFANIAAVNRRAARLSNDESLREFFNHEARIWEHAAKLLARDARTRGVL